MLTYHNLKKRRFGQEIIFFVPVRKLGFNQQIGINEKGIWTYITGGRVEEWAERRGCALFRTQERYGTKAARVSKYFTGPSPGARKQVTCWTLSPLGTQGEAEGGWHWKSLYAKTTQYWGHPRATWPMVVISYIVMSLLVYFLSLAPGISPLQQPPAVVHCCIPELGVVDNQEVPVECTNE